ncbi:MAG: hypothetical protein JWQ57_3475, partial [Mucilaginibacter sp.]|nr:hypothetical protein [Mucilaginibacter sp.]
TQQLTKPFPGQLLKARAIFRWITDNIAYDYKYYNKFAYKGKTPKGFECRGDSLDCETRKHVWANKYTDNVLNEKKAVCEGYSMLFKKMCDIAGIESEIIPGYVRTEYYQIGNMGELDHSWNAVHLNSTWYLLDPTWAAGGCPEDDNGKLLSFQKQFNEYYWLTPPDEFAKNHYPESAKWVLLAKYKKENFESNPYYAPNEVANIKLISPNSGIIKAKKGDTIRFKLAYTGSLRRLQINSNIFQNPDIWTLEYISKRKAIKMPDTLAIKKQQFIKYKRDGQAIEFVYVVKDNTLSYLDIIFDTRRVMRFNVRINR